MYKIKIYITHKLNTPITKHKQHMKLIEIKQTISNKLWKIKIKHDTI